MEFRVDVKKDETGVWIDKDRTKITFQRKTDGIRVTFLSGSAIFNEPEELDFFKATLVNVIDNILQEWKQKGQRGSVPVL
ncbi:MAG: hypothetical protein OEZ48_00545 [Candidatus Bathyarchaeota archaeon]|nr:hypothetical protein [Candidatus Bathyarchaeota archaeon]